MEILFTGKRILVTGAGRGIGRDACKTLIKAKAKVFGLSRTKEHLDSLVAECPDLIPVCVDLANWEETRKAVEAILPIDGLVNNAGLALMSPFLEVTSQDFDMIFDVNVKAVLNVSQVVAKSMQERGQGGSIVNVSSAASLVPVRGSTIYSASKSALDMITRVMALELGKSNIRVNCVNPTVVMTDMGKAMWSNPDANKMILDRIPLGKFADTEDVVNAIVFLLSDKSQMTTGAAFPVDGGRTRV